MLALGFVSPWLLWGLALGAVPILIQWLHRRNYTERVWAAMRFLRAATRSQSRRLRFESLLLLAIRVLILVLATLALAEPFLESSGWLPTGESSVHRLIVIDTSLSMLYESDGRAVSERAREAARRLAARSQPGDSCQIVAIGREGRAVVGLPAFDSAQVLDELEQLQWSEEYGDVAAAFQLAGRMLAESPAAGRTEVNIISDFQRSNWWPEDQSVRLRVQRQLSEIADHARLSFYPVGIDAPANVAITDVTLEPSLVTVGTSLHITARLQQFGRRDAREIRTELVENDRVIQTTSVPLSPSGQGTATFATRWHEAGQRGLSVRIATDGLTADDRRWLTADVRDELTVLLVNGRESGESLARATAFVEIALSPQAGLSPGNSTGGYLQYRPTVISEADLARTELSLFDVVFLCDLPFLSEAEQSRLQTFVGSGGGLVISLGEQVHPDAYNQWLGDPDNGLMPVQLLSIEGIDDASEEPVHFAEPQGRHPIVEPFAGNPQAGLTTANIYRYYRCQIDEPADLPVGSKTRAQVRIGGETGGSSARVAVAFANGDPAILEHEYGAGRVLLITTTLDDRWGSWALWPSFLPMIYRIVDYACAQQGQTAQMVGEPIRREFPVQTVGLSVQMEQPDGRRLAGRTSLAASTTQVLLGEARQSGLYRLLLGPPLSDTELVAVNVDSRESDLQTMNESDLRETVFRGIDATLIVNPDRPDAASASVIPNSPMTHWLLAIVLVLLLVEQLMAWNARYGLVALAASPLIVGSLSVMPTISTLVGMCVLAFVVVLRRYSARFGK